MNKTLCVIVCMALALNVFSQKILYSNNQLYSEIKYEYYIVGKVSDNIIVWRTEAKNYTSLIFSTQGEYKATPQTEGGRRYSSTIFVYNNNMQLIKTVNTNILENAVDIQPYFFTSKNSCSMIYSCLSGDTLMHKIASFDADGKLQDDIILYSSKVKEQDVLKPENGYFIMRSNDKKSACFIKAVYDKSNYNLKFIYSFIGDTIVNKEFSFSIDINKKALTSMNIDNDKNLLFMFEEKKGDSCTVEIMRKDFSDDLMLVADKTLKANGFKMYSAHIEQTATGYICFGELDNKSDKDLFVWQTNETLDDIAHETVLDKKLDGLQMFVPSMHTMLNTFVIWNDDINYVAPAKRWYRFYKRSRYAGAFSNSNNTFSVIVPVNNIEVFWLDSLNTITWSKKFDNSQPGKTSIDLSNFRLFQGNNHLHIVYAGMINNNPKFLNHLVISADGVVEEKNFTAWDARYWYNLERSKLVDGNTLIVPALKGSKLQFAKVVLE